MYDNEYLGKKVVVTGAAGVFGQWISQAFASQGAFLYLSDKRQDALEECVQTLSAKTNVLHHSTDFCDLHSIDEFVQLISEQWSAPDIVINNAGIYPSHLLSELSVGEWEEIFRINVTTPFILTKEFTKLMIKQKIQGSVINISSGAAVTTWSGAGHYSTSKAALEMLTRAFALELAPFNIRVNAVRPGFAPGSVNSLMSKEYIDAMQSTIPLGRTSGPNDMPEALLFLCSSRASYITGTVLTVDGGRSAGTNSLPFMGEQK